MGRTREEGDGQFKYRTNIDQHQPRSRTRAPGRQGTHQSNNKQAGGCGRQSDH